MWHCMKTVLMRLKRSGILKNGENGGAVDSRRGLLEAKGKIFLDA